MELWESAQRLGWNQARLAQQLEMSRGGLNGIIKGRTVPSAATLKLFRLVLEGDAGMGPCHLREEPTKYMTQAEREVVDSLASLPEKDARRVLPAIKSMIEAVRPISGKMS